MIASPADWARFDSHSATLDEHDANPETHAQTDRFDQCPACVAFRAQSQADHTADLESLANPEAHATAGYSDPCPAPATHRPRGYYAPCAPCDTRVTSWICGPDFAAWAGTVDVSSAYARADHPASAQPPRGQPQVRAPYIDDTRHFMPAAPEAHRG